MATMTIENLGFPWATRDPFLFCVHHLDFYPKGNGKGGPAATLRGRQIGNDFIIKDGWRMYHGDKIPGFPAHPHRGFETVTVVQRGMVDHADSMGAAGRYGGGDVQWMTAGKGIVHEEYHSHSFTREGGTFEMCQLWVNLPKQHKMTKPRYQAILKEDIPRVTLPLNRQPGDDNEDDASRVTATIRLIAGSMAGVKGPAKTFSPLQLWDVILPHTGSLVDIPFPKDQTCIVFVRRGRVQIVSGDGEQQNHRGHGQIVKSS